MHHSKEMYRSKMLEGDNLHVLGTNNHLKYSHFPNNQETLSHSQVDHLKLLGYPLLGIQGATKKSKLQKIELY